jgi:hypothetical protein
MARPEYDGEKWDRFITHRRIFVRTWIDKQRKRDSDEDIREAMRQSPSEYLRETK